MDTTCHRSRCDACPVRYLCRCLEVTEDAVIEVATALQLRTVQDVVRHTGAGDGCTACRRRIQGVLARLDHSSSSPYICSVK
jgi:bacterioferritin-associated ferredoxin